MVYNVNVICSILSQIIGNVLNCTRAITVKFRKLQGSFGLRGNSAHYTEMITTLERIF